MRVHHEVKSFIIRGPSEWLGSSLRDDGAVSAQSKSEEGGRGRVSTGARKPRRGNMRFLPPLEMRLSSIAPNPVESREAPPNSTVTLTSQRHLEKLLYKTGSPTWCFVMTEVGGTQGREGG